MKNPVYVETYAMIGEVIVRKPVRPKWESNPHYAAVNELIDSLMSR